jgi:hypothetical protein
VARHREERLLVERIVGRDEQHVPLLSHAPHVDRHDPRGDGDVGRDEVEELAGEVDVEEVHPRHAQLVRQRLGNLQLRHVAHRHERLSQAPARLLLLRQRLGEL